MRKICPFISINQPANQGCVFDGCSLWVKTGRGGQCAIAAMAEAADNISDHVDEIAHADPLGTVQG